MSEANNSKRIQRLVKLIGILQAGNGLGAEDLARQCGVSKRTSFRDLEVLRQAGVPVIFDSSLQQYRISGTYFLPPTNLTPEEALALISLAHSLGPGSGPGSELPYLETARSAATKLENSLPHALRDYLQTLVPKVQLRLPSVADTQDKPAMYSVFVSALSDRRSVRVKYHSPDDDQPETTKINPYRLLFYLHSWYVIGRSSLHREVRTFHLGRFQNAQLLDDTYSLPERFSLDRYFGNAWRMIPGEGGDQQVVIRFTPKVAKNVAGVIWHKTQQVQAEKDGSLLFTVTVTGIDEISWWVLGYGDQAEVLQPASLRDLILQRAEKMVAKYKS